MLTKIWTFVKGAQYELFLVICVALISITSYQLGRIQSYKKLPLNVGQDAAIYQAAHTENSQARVGSPVPRDPRVVVSKASDSKKYHFMWCSGAQRIKEENKLWFANEGLAQQAGYTLADNCQ